MKKRKINKGAPSGFVISLIFHTAAFFVAGLFVVFTVVNKPEPEFVPPPPIDRPKMNLKKPKVKVKKSSNPKPSSRIVAKVKTKAMPEIQLPDIAGIGDGLLGLDGFGADNLAIPDIQEITLMGNSFSTGIEFEGTYYDLKRRPDGRYTGNNVLEERVYEFLHDGWDISVFNKFYQAPIKRYATCFVIPTMSSSVAPSAFGQEPASGFNWLVLFKGKLVHKEDITFRFWGAGDMFLVVRVDNEIVLASAVSHVQAIKYFGGLWASSSGQTGIYNMGYPKAVVGDWITLNGGEVRNMEVLLGDDGGVACFMLGVEVKGVDYELNDQGGPILPAFKTGVLSHDMIDHIYMDLTVGDLCLTNGPIFNDI